MKWSLCNGVFLNVLWPGDVPLTVWLFPEGGAVGQSTEERRRTVSELQAVFREAAFPFHIVPLEQVSEDRLSKPFNKNRCKHVEPDQTDARTCPPTLSGSGPSRISCGASTVASGAAEQRLQIGCRSFHPEWRQQLSNAAEPGASIPTWGSEIQHADPAAADRLGQDTDGQTRPAQLVKVRQRGAWPDRSWSCLCIYRALCPKTNLKKTKLNTQWHTYSFVYCRTWPIILYCKSLKN